MTWDDADRLKRFIDAIENREVSPSEALATLDIGEILLILAKDARERFYRGMED